MHLDRLLVQLKRHEGLRLKPYIDTAGHLSIGYGRNLAGVGLTREEAEMLLANDVARTWAALAAALPWVTGLDPVRQNVLANMCFNLGLKGLLGFQTTLGHVQGGHYAEAAQAMLTSKWASQVGARARELARQMASGDW